MTDPFESPKLLMKGALGDIDEVLEMSASFLRNNPPTQFARIGPTMTVVGVRIADPPEKLRHRAAGVIDDLRHVLDQACFNAARALGKKGTRTYFPFSEGPSDLETQFLKKNRGEGRNSDGRSCDLPVELRPHLRTLAPYWPSAEHPEGNLLLRALGSVSGPNKHQALIKTAFSAEDFKVQNLSRCFISPPQWFPERRELVLLYADLFGRSVYRIWPGPTFFTFEFEGRIGSQPIDTVLPELASIVQGILKGIEAETARILRERAD